MAMTEITAFYLLHFDSLEPYFPNLHCFSGWIGRNYTKNELDLELVLKLRKNYLRKTKGHGRHGKI